MKITLLYCAECDRPLTKAAVQIPTKDGVRSYGPKCGARFIVKPERRRSGNPRKPRPRKAVDTRQRDWVNEK